jgi:hypothetical protein
MNPSSLLLFAVLASPSVAKAIALQEPARQEGILQPWESKTVLDQIQKDTRSLIQALAQLNAEHWKGDYEPLVASTRQRVLDVSDSLERLARKPESLALAVDALLSMQHIETNVDSLARGAERFQPSTVAALDQATSVFLDARSRLQTYLVDLARYIEKNLSVIGKDLESCREQIWKRPPPGTNPVRRR